MRNHENGRLTKCIKKVLENLLSGITSRDLSIQRSGDVYGVVLLTRNFTYLPLLNHDNKPQTVNNISSPLIFKFYFVFLQLFKYTIEVLEHSQ